MRGELKRIKVKGVAQFLPFNRITDKTFNVGILNEGHTKVIVIDNGITQFTIPFEPLEQYLK